MTDSLDDRISKLSPAKRQLLEKRLAEMAAQAGHASTIPRRNPDEPIALSSSQQRFWFIHELEPDVPMFNVPRVRRLRGPLDIAALTRSLDTLVARHAVLRTTYVQDASGKVWQSILRDVHFDMPVVDLRGEPDLEERLAAHLDEDFRRRFDLTRDLSLRATLYIIGDEEYVYCETHHHIATDAWASGILRRELNACYAAYHAGREPVLPDIALDYADFAVWQRQQVHTESFGRQLAYWRQQLQPPLPPLELPEDQPRVPGAGRRGGSVATLIPESRLHDLQKLGREHGATLFISVTAAFLALLHRYTAQRDLVFGVLTAGRSRVEFERIVGSFINPVVFRVEVNGALSYVRLLERIRDVAFAAFANQDVPFERVVAEIQPDRQAGTDPLTRLMLDFLNTPGAEWSLPGIDSTSIPLRRAMAEYDILFTALPSGDGLEVSLRYNAHMFSQGLMRRMLDHLQVIMESVCAAPDKPISDLPYLTPSEAKQLLVDWNQTGRKFELDKTISDLFEERARLAPAALAAMDGRGPVNYGELSRRVHHLAAALAAAGARRTDLRASQPIVAVLARRSVDLLTAMLAIFRCGGVYMPLDPRAPSLRQRQILSQSGAGFVLAEAGLAHLLRADLNATPGPTILDLDTLLGGETAAAFAPAPVGPLDLAYVIYTSGSTGVPKGAMVEHRGMLNHLWLKVVDLGLDRNDIVAQTAPQVFDISVWQFLAPLLAGGAVHIFADEIAFDPTALLSSVDATGVTVLETVPSMMAALLEQNALQPPEAGLRHLRWLIATGEALPPSLSREWFSAYPHVRQLNAYGPTECSDDVTHHVMDALPDTDLDTVPIGRPVANMRLYVLDADMHPLPVGIIGELYAGGVGVGRGYLHDPARTAESFVPDPFSETPGARLYRTGDLARWLPDGTIDFQGRADHQVKIRGMRIELGDIESALLACPGVQEAAVIAQDFGALGKHLAGFVTSKLGAPLHVAGLETELRQRLPAYMVPGALVIMEDFPRTATGKIDRRALPLPHLQARRTDGAVAGPNTPTERRIADLWCELLRLPEVGVHDDFFAMGGQSLLAAQLIYRLRQEFGGDVPLRALFEHPTIAGFAAYLDSRTPPWGQPGSYRHLLVLQPNGRRTPVYLLPGGGGGESEYLHVYANLIHQLGPDQPVYGFQAQTADGEELPFDTVPAMAAAYVSELRRLQPHGPYLLAGECIGAKLALEMSRQLAAAGEPVAGVLFLNAVVAGTAGQTLGPQRVRNSLSRRFRQLRSLPAAERLPRLRLMARNAAVAVLPVSAAQRREQAQRSARLGYLALLSAFRPDPVEGDVTLLMTSDLVERGRAEAWREIVHGSLAVIPLAGVHRTYLGVHVAATAAIMRACLDDMQQGTVAV